MRLHIVAVAVASLALGACTERAQTSIGIKSDTRAFEGTHRAPFMASGWKPGDAGSWEQHLKTRTWNGQNDYAKVN